MRRLALTLAMVVLLSGCSFGNQEMEEALKIRGRLVSSPCSFRCHITADYIETIEQFTLDCSVDSDGALTFSVVEPQTISGVSGKVNWQEGALTFDEAVLAFPLMADDRISPVVSPWLLINTLKQGCITACTREGGGLHLTIDDSYSDDALTLEVWTDGEGNPISGEICWQGRRVVSMSVVEFVYL